MKITELMVGDLVKDDCNRIIEIQEIINFGREDGHGYINGYWSCGEDGCKVCEECTSISYLEPIPLTMEILEKNGWKEMPSGTVCHYDRFDNSKSIICDKGLVFTFLDRTFKPIYVHQLQHALRLCGLGELADNLKIE